MTRLALLLFLAGCNVNAWDPPNAALPVDCGNGLRCPALTTCGGGPYAVGRPAGACCPISGPELGARRTDAGR
jgi:hypothetical protein